MALAIVVLPLTPAGGVNCCRSAGRGQGSEGGGDLHQAHRGTAVGRVADMSTA